jgi:uncharacterized membrane protein (UPF0127 family)
MNGNTIRLLVTATRSKPGEQIPNALKLQFSAKRKLLLMLKIVNASKKVLIVDRAQIANTDEDRRIGLLERQGIARGEGLWIVPCQQVHTIGMRFPIDIVFLDKSGKVVQVEPRVPEGFRVACPAAYSVLEIAPGRALDTGLNLGDKLVFQRA